MMEFELEEITPRRRPLRIYTAWYGTRQSWIGQYRLHQPLDAGRKIGELDYILDNGSNLSVQELRFQAMTLADAHIYHLITGDFVLNLCLKAPRPTVIWSADDHIEAIEPFNPQFVGMGTRNLSGKPLNPGDTVFVINAAGEHLPLWEDKKTIEHSMTFDIERNYKTIDLLKAIAHEADGVVVSTPELAKVYAEYGSRNIYIYPNSIDFELYPKVELSEHPGEVRILWTGGSSHYADLYTIREPLLRVLDRYPHVKFFAFGNRFRALNKWLGDKLNYIDWVEPDAYPFRLSTIGHDINLCPLRVSDFSRCKSAIKWYESSAICRPAATLAANYGPFTEIEDSVTGMLYESPVEFEEKLSALVEDATMRKRLAANAQTWLRENRDYMKTIKPYTAWMRQTCEETRERLSQASRTAESILEGASG